ncbi:hypothetical protein D3C75_1322270 [compost metagenome]
MDRIFSRTVTGWSTDTVSAYRNLRIPSLYRMSTSSAKNGVYALDASSKPTETPRLNFWA